jgi:hypothetical protein
MTLRLANREARVNVTPGLEKVGNPCIKWSHDDERNELRDTLDGLHYDKQIN